MGRADNNMPAYAVLNNQSGDGKNTGAINLRNLMASILFKGAFVGIGYDRPNPDINELSNMFRFFRIFRDIKTAVEQFINSLRETAKSA